MTISVVDASVVLAVARNEVPVSSVSHILANCTLSAVNLCEIETRLLDHDLLRKPQVQQLLSMIGTIESFTERRARHAASLRPLTRHVGLSLGDRACIALGMELNADVYTADRVWPSLNLPCRIHLVR